MIAFDRANDLRLRMKLISWAFVNSCMQTCIIGLDHARLGAREVGSSGPYIVFDLNCNDKNVYVMVRPYSKPIQRSAENELSLESEVIRNMSIEDIGATANTIIQSFGEYRVLENNCHKFVARLADEIGVPGLARRKWLVTRPFWEDND